MFSKIPIKHNSQFVGNMYIFILADESIICIFVVSVTQQSHIQFTSHSILSKRYFIVGLRYFKLHRTGLRAAVQLRNQGPIS